MENPNQIARDAGLRYVTDLMPGIRRVGKATKFSYVDTAGKTVKDPADLQRIKSLAVPPAYTDVWI
ncbi:MAG: DNA topoisomerase IB, partial [Candidatus Eremiobacteraeota bacterium]|nr:DNA topoisomerase IB [Candidatus Eremiobacteraeota bacterium]